MIYVMMSGEYEDVSNDFVLVGPDGLDLAALNKEFDGHFKAKMKGLRKKVDREQQAVAWLGFLDAHSIGYALQTRCFLRWLRIVWECNPVSFTEAHR